MTLLPVMIFFMVYRRTVQDADVNHGISDFVLLIVHAI